MKKDKVKDAFLEQLRKTPIVQAVCEKMNIARWTAYRWKRDDPEFAKAFDTALREGQSLVTDVALSQLLNAIKSGNLNAAQFWLKHFDDNFKTKVDITGRILHERRDLSDEEKALLKDALRMAVPKESKREK